jgi:hypothetical protein
MVIKATLDVINEYKMMIKKNSCCDAHRVVDAPFDLVILNYNYKDIFFPMVLCKMITTSDDTYFFSRSQEAVSRILQIIKPLKNVHGIIVVRFTSKAPKPTRWAIVWIDDVMPIKVEKNYGNIITYIN